MFSKLLGREQVELVSPLSREDCGERLAKAVRSRWNPLGRGHVVGTVGTHGFMIYTSGSRRYRLVLRADMQDAPTGTRVLCQLSRSPMIFVPFLFFLLFLLVNGINLWRSQGLSTRDNAGAIATVVLIAVIYGGYLAFRILRSADDRGILLDFLKAQLEASESPVQSVAATISRRSRD